VPRKTVAIRGLDTELYHEVFSMAKKDGKRVSEVVNQALAAFLNGDINNNGGNGKNVEKGTGVFTLKNEGEISLSKSDINGLKKEVGKFRIETSGRLTFEKDLDKESLRNIEKIVIHDGTIVVPRTLFSQFLLRSEIYGKIEKY
jgi:hypothetical protein